MTCVRGADIGHGNVGGSVLKTRRRGGKRLFIGQHQNPFGVPKNYIDARIKFRAPEVSHDLLVVCAQICKIGMLRFTIG
jgi:hypothetical protein